MKANISNINFSHLWNTETLLFLQTKMTEKKERVGMRHDGVVAIRAVRMGEKRGGEGEGGSNMKMV